MTTSPAETGHKGYVYVQRVNQKNRHVILNIFSH